MKKNLILLFFILNSLCFTFSQPKIYLAAIGPGDEIFLRWGHFAIVVQMDNGDSYLYDYGNFSFQQEAFYENFIKGIMTYFKYRKNGEFELQYYINANRDITLQELNLTSEQTDEYIKKLQEEIKPENRFYQYDHYYNNCVSQMTDYLNDITDGEFYKGTDKKIGRSFRDLSRDYVSSNYLYNLLIMFVLGSKVDYEITEKESLFLPEYTMNRAKNVIINFPDGTKRPLIKNNIDFYKSSGRDPVIPESKPKTSLNIIIGLVISLFSVIISRTNKFAQIIQIIIGLFGGFAGSLLFFMAFFTGHYYIHNNWNLILVNPLTFTLLISGIFKLIKKFRSKGERLTTLFIDITLFSTVIMIFLKLIGVIKQDNSEIIALFIPLLIVNSSIKRFIPKTMKVK